MESDKVRVKQLRRFCYGSSHNIMLGLQQEIGLQAGVDYLPDGHHSARVMTLRLRGLNPHYLARVSGMVDELTMWAGLDDRHRVRIGWAAGHTVLIEIPKPPKLWDLVTVDNLLDRHAVQRGYRVTLGLGLQGEPRRVDFSEPAMAHLFLAGQTRSGKTNAQRLIAWNLARNLDPAQGRMLILDVVKQGYRWQDLSRLPHLAHPLVTDLDEAERVAHWLTLEIERRGARGYAEPRIFVLIDELKALVEDSEPVRHYLNRVAAVGGEFGVHLVLATQYPQIKMLGSGSAELKRNVTTRLCGRVDDATAAANALGLSGSGAERLGGYGDFLLKSFDGELTRLTVARVDPAHVAQLPSGEPGHLTLPEPDQVIRPVAQARNQPDPLEPEQVAVALFEPGGIVKLAQRLGIGKTKATRVKQFAEGIRDWATANGHECLMSDT